VGGLGLERSSMLNLGNWIVVHPQVSHKGVPMDDASHGD
jgi:hypothetical protein